MLNLDKELKELEKLSSVIKTSLDKIEGNLSNINQKEKNIVASSINDIKQALNGKKDIKEVINNIQRNADNI